MDSLPPGKIKVNYNASWFQEKGETGLGIIYRNVERTLMVVRGVKYLAALILIGEALMVKVACKFIRKKKWRGIVIELDSLEVIQQPSKENKMRSNTDTTKNIVSRIQNHHHSGDSKGK